MSGGAGPPDVHRLFEEHYLGLVRLATQLLHDRASAEDVVQDVFAALHKHPGTIGAPLPYLRSAVVNRAHSALTPHHRNRRRGVGVHRRLPPTRSPTTRL